MTRVSSSNVTSVLCALWLGACAGTAPDAGKTTTADRQSTQPAKPAPDASSDVATIAKDLPGTLDGEVRRAQLLRDKGDLDDAGRALAQLMLVAPDDARVVGEYGKVLAQQGHPQTALPFLERATELQPKDWKLYSALGVAYDQSDDHTHARLAYEHALTLAPGEPSVLNNYAVSRMLSGDLTGAHSLLAQASVKGPENPKIANNAEMLTSLQKPATRMPDRPVPATAVATSHTAKTENRVAVAPPKALAPGVVMQAVPMDPLAGPVKSRTTTHPVLASAAKPKDQAAHVSAPPALRTAADEN